MLLLTVLWTGLGMGVGLFCGIVGLVSWSAITRRTPEMDLAYRNVCDSGCDLLRAAARFCGTWCERCRRQPRKRKAAVGSSAKVAGRRGRRLH